MLKLLLAGLLATALTPAHALFEDNEARKAILNLRSKVERQEFDFAKQMRALENRLDRIQQTAQGQLALQQEIETLRAELASLRGRVEEASNEISKSQRSQRSQFAKIDSRIKSVEPVMVQIDGEQVSVERAEQRMFEAALNQFRAASFGGAENAFAQFQLQYPDSAYSPEAMFWLGSSQYAQKKYELAAGTQAALVDRFPDSGRAPDALLNKAFSEIELRRKKAARKTYQLVQERYPDSTAASTAKARLARLK